MRQTIQPTTILHARRLTKARLVMLSVAVAGTVLIGGCATDAPGREAGPPEGTRVDAGWRMRSVDTSMKVDLPEPFIRLVDLTRLRVGMTTDEVLAIFPDPFEINLRRGDELWQYGFAELIFRDGRLRDWFDL